MSPLSKGWGQNSGKKKKKKLKGGMDFLEKTRRVSKNGEPSVPIKIEHLKAYS